MHRRFLVPLCLSLSVSSLACGGTSPSAPDDASANARADASATDVVDASVPDVVDASAPDAGPPRFVAVSANSTGHTCAVRSDGTLWCWGLNDRGQLARAPQDSAGQCAVRGSSPPSSRPCDTRARRATGFTDVTDVAVGNGTTCALRRDGSVWCWGLNDAGELGQGRPSGDASPTPVRVPIPAARHVALGAFHACAVLTDGSVRCWGSNKFAQAGVALDASPARCDEGDGTLSPCAPSPVAVAGITNARAVSLGRWHSCALLEDRSVRCWGLNDSAQLGNGRVDPDSAPHASPVTPMVDRATAVASGGSHTCALRDDGTLRCWGWGDLGQLADAPTAECGSGRTFQCATSPAALPAPTSVAAVAAGRYHTCTVGRDGATRCFGRNDNGQAGAAPSNAVTCLSVPDRFPCVRAPVEVPLSPVSAVSLGDYHACALTLAGEVRCWGWNQFGQLGDGSTDDRSVPVLVGRAE